MFFEHVYFIAKPHTFLRQSERRPTAPFRLYRPLWTFSNNSLKKIMGQRGTRERAGHPASQCRGLAWHPLLSNKQGAHGQICYTQVREKGAKREAMRPRVDQHKIESIKSPPNDIVHMTRSPDAVMRHS